MKFTYLAFFCCALWTLVSALPLGLLGSESTLRGSFAILNEFTVASSGESFTGTDQRVEQKLLYARTGDTAAPAAGIKGKWVDYEKKTKEYVMQRASKIVPSRNTDTKSHHQRVLAHEIKRAPSLLLLPYTE